MKDIHGARGPLVRELLTSEERLGTVDYLVSESPVVEFDELVSHLCTDSLTIEEFAVRLHHIHLPKLAAVDAIEWDRGSGVVTLTESGRQGLRTIRQTGLTEPQAQASD